MSASYTNYQLEVTLKTGGIKRQLKCSKLQTFTEEENCCDAYATIFGFEMNQVTVNGEIVQPTNYSTFKDTKGQVWQIIKSEGHTPPEAPGLTFCLMKV